MPVYYITLSNIIRILVNKLINSRTSYYLLYEQCTAGPQFMSEDHILRDKWYRFVTPWLELYLIISYHIIYHISYIRSYHIIADDGSWTRNIILKLLLKTVHTLLFIIKLRKVSDNRPNYHILFLYFETSQMKAICDRFKAINHQHISDRTKEVTSLAMHRGQPCPNDPNLQVPLLVYIPNCNSLTITVTQSYLPRGHYSSKKWMNYLTWHKPTPWTHTPPPWGK